MAEKPKHVVIPPEAWHLTVTLMVRTARKITYQVSGYFDCYVPKKMARTRRWVSFAGTQTFTTKDAVSKNVCARVLSVLTKASWPDGYTIDVRNMESRISTSLSLTLKGSKCARVSVVTIDDTATPPAIVSLVNLTTDADACNAKPLAWLKNHSELQAACDAADVELHVANEQVSFASCSRRDGDFLSYPLDEVWGTPTSVTHFEEIMQSLDDRAKEIAEAREAARVEAELLAEAKDKAKRLFTNEELKRLGVHV